MNALDTRILNNPDLSALERAAYYGDSADAWRAYCAALEAELDDMGEYRAEAERLGDKLATAAERLNTMEEEHAIRVADLAAEISRLNDALQDVGEPDTGATDTSGESGSASTGSARTDEASGEDRAPRVICSAGLPIMATHPVHGEIIELRSIDGAAVRVSRRQYENAGRDVLAMFTRAGEIKRGRGIHRGNLLTDGAELTPAAQLESALRVHGWRVARWPRSAEQRAKLYAQGFRTVTQTAPGEFAEHPLGLAWAMAARQAPAASDPAAGVVTPSGEAANVQASGEDPAPLTISNDYDARQAARRERYATLADKMRTASAMHYSASRRAVENIPFGQPILVGHHSERGHRATLARAHRAMDRSCEAASKAEHYAQRAASVGTGGISSDDPAALVKLRAELAQVEALQAKMKAANKSIRTHKMPEAQAAALVALGMTESQAGALLKPDFMGRVGFPDYRLKNNGANARRIAARIAELETSRQAADVERDGHGYTYREDVDENRVMFEFPAKPADAVRDILKGAGFRWSPSRGAWVRQLNAAGRWHGQDAARRIDAIGAPGEGGEATPSGETAAEAAPAPAPAPEPGTMQAPAERRSSKAWTESRGREIGGFHCVNLFIPCDGSLKLRLAAAVYSGGETCSNWARDVEGMQAFKGIAGTIKPSGEQSAAAAPSDATTSGEDEARAVVGTPDRAEKIKTVERRDRDGITRTYLAGVPKACPTLLAGRWIPDGAERIAADAATGAEVWMTASRRAAGQVAIIAYGGKRTKHDVYYTMRDRAQAERWAGEYLGKIQDAAQRQADRRAEKSAARAAGHQLQAGDVLRCSWGYDQTNIDYYEVTRLVGRRMVEIRQIAAQSVDTGNMTGDCVPAPGHYIGEPMRKAVSDYDGRSVRIASYASAHKIEPREVGGVKVWPVDHWSAYA